ncbi:MAG: aminotransferase class I/II-fold pyridoxal phosphate-dependent enzyme [Cyclobacteriaceae bacterium]
MPQTHSLPGRTVITEGKERLYFSGTSYLGINHQPEYQQLLMEGIQQYGGNYSSSRSSNLQLAIYEEAETFMAQWLGTQSVLTFSSGFQAGQALMNALPRDAHYIFAPKTHPAVWQTDQQVWQGDFPSWVLSLPAQLANSKAEETIIVANSLDPLFAEKYRFDWLADLPKAKRIHVIIDDSHGLGVLGDRGEGIISQLTKHAPAHVQLTIAGSIGKALGIPGGVVAGTDALIKQLRKSPFFTAASPVAPAYLHAFLRVQNLYQQTRKQLRDRARRFQQAVSDTQLFNYFDDYPVFYTPHHELNEVLKSDFVLSSFPYPDPDSEPVTRVVLNALHTEEDIGKLTFAIKDYADELNAYQKRKL